MTADRWGRVARRDAAKRRFEEKRRENVCSPRAGRRLAGEGEGYHGHVYADGQGEVRLRRSCVASAARRSADCLRKVPSFPT